MGRVAILLSENYQVLGQLSDYINQLRRDIIELTLKKKNLKISIEKAR